MNPSSTAAQETDNPDQNETIARRQSVLDEPGLREDDTKFVRDQRIATISRSYQDILKSIGEDPNRQGSL